MSTEGFLKTSQFLCPMPASRVFALTAMEKIFRKAGAERVALGAQQALGEAVEEEGRKIAKNASRFAHHAGRKTVKASDIQLAVRD
jgi:histone H3/H4